MTCVIYLLVLPLSQGLDWSSTWYAKTKASPTKDERDKTCDDEKHDVLTTETTTATIETITQVIHSATGIGNPR